MKSPDFRSLTPAARNTALWVARLIFYNGLLIGAGLCIIAVGVIFFNFGGLTRPSDLWLVGGVLSGLALLAFGFAAIARVRVKKLKQSGT